MVLLFFIEHSKLMNLLSLTFVNSVVFPMGYNGQVVPRSYILLGYRL